MASGKLFKSIFPVVFVVVCLKLLISEEPKVSGKLFKSIFPVVFVVVVVVVWLKLLISDDPNVSGKLFKSIFPVVFVVVVVVIWLKLLISDEAKGVTFAFPFTSNWFILVCTFGCTIEWVFLKYLLISSFSEIGVTKAIFALLFSEFTDWYCVVVCWKYLLNSLFPLIWEVSCPSPNLFKSICPLLEIEVVVVVVCCWFIPKPPCWLLKARVFKSIAPCCEEITPVSDPKEFKSMPPKFETSFFCLIL